MPNFSKTPGGDLQQTMKTKTTTLEGNTAWPCVSKSDAEREFRRKVKSVEGANNYVDTFLDIAREIQREKQSFFLSDFLYAARFYGIPANTIAEIFSQWTAEMIRLKKLTQLEGCYSDSPLYIQN